MRLKLACISLATALAAGPQTHPAAVAGTADTAAGLARIALPEGFEIELFAEVPNARSMTMGDRGTLFVGTRKGGKVYALPLERGADGYRAGAARVLAGGLDTPNGVAFRDGDLYVAEIGRILRFDDVERPGFDGGYRVVYDDYPTARHHGWKFIAFGPDGRLYVPIGVPCNVCDEEGYGVITRMNPDGTGRETFARGVRNSVGFTWRPGTDVMWFTDNGRDWLGDDVPPDELNRAPRAGLHFGFPHCHGGEIPDPDFAQGHDCSEFTPPARKLGPHVAALGLTFYTGDMFPAAYRGRIFIAEHGSWNRSVPIGYRITQVTLDGPEAVSYEVFAEGWLQDGEAWGRPVDVLMLDDGSLLVSDDHGGRIYRITYKG